MTAWPCSPASGGAEVLVQLLYAGDCPHVGEVRTVLQRCLARGRLPDRIEEVEGPWPSPTVLVNGVDVTGRAAGDELSCRLDLPSEEQILAALDRLAYEWPASGTSASASPSAHGTDGPPARRVRAATSKKRSRHFSEQK